MHKSHLRLVVATMAFALALVAGGCAFLLDTDSLQEGKSTAGGDGWPCADDSSCFETPTDDPCTKDWCDPVSKLCRRIPHKGLALRAESPGHDELISSQAEIGLPVLTTDADGNFYLGYFARQAQGGEGDVRLVRLADNANAPSVNVRLAQVTNGIGTGHSSPGLEIVANRLRVAVAGTLSAAGQGEAGMYRFQLEKDSLTPPVQGVDQMLLDKDPAYASFPARLTAPRIVRHGSRDLVLWVHQGAVFTHDWATADTTSNSFSLINATNAVPIAGGIGFKFGAVVEAESSGSDGLYIWTEGKNTLTVQLDSNSGTRLGLASAALHPKAPTSPTLNVVHWAYHQAPEPPQLKLGGALCDLSKCTAQSFGAAAAEVAGGLWPSVDIITPDISADQRRIVAVHSFISNNVAALLLNAYEVDAADLAKKIPLEDLAINPSMVRVTEPQPIDDNLPSSSPYGPTAVATTSKGKIVVAWVHHRPSGEASLRTKRYYLDKCAP
ncbi:MAG: hypothetical protein MUF54_12815 [Polyangiaceae bacterium]|jgi:hypothetical protein|nr:hypothetical protein [Polyangiaceae bacterium]